MRNWDYLKYICMDRKVHSQILCVVLLSGVLDVGHDSMCFTSTAH